jgi:hypothetical protein
MANGRKGHRMFPLLVALGFVVVMIAADIYRQRRSAGFDAARQPASVEASDLLEGDGVVVFYLYRAARCYSCVRLEQLTRAAVETAFAEDIRRGRVAFQVVNVGQKANQPLARKYGVYTQTVIAAEVVGGEEKRWKALPGVWELLYNEDAFRAYIRTEVAAYFVKEEPAPIQDPKDREI